MEILIGKKSIVWVIIICSKFDCWKNLLDTILLLLDTIRAIIIFFVNCSKIKNHEKSSAVRVFRAVSLLDKKILTARIAIGRKGFEKCQLLITIYSKENGVHVRQLG